MSRIKQLKTCIPDIFSYKTLLYIGANPRRMELIGNFLSHNYEIDAMEIWKPNFDALVKLNRVRKYFKTIFLGNAEKASQIIDWKYDIVMFWHGPEHLQEAKIRTTLIGFTNLARKYVIVACPFGRYIQGPERGNPHETHLTHLYPGFFTPWGWETSTIGEKNTKGSNLIAWREIN